ncbi:hypothetical protein [Streptomyces sp. NBC_01465]|uniref:hypothetical protein n=1 Tax=Streptomyces sp. NBC_01465 TaxID=2903878 RepID=UPI002E31C447|nr:hypothetical protein [Streptomyces sp. NBC_01465]
MCFVAVLGAFAPRLALLFLWLFTNLVTRPFDSWIAPLIGLVFLPFTTLMFVLSWSPVSHVSGIGWLFVVLGLLFDLGDYEGGKRARS